MMQSISHWGQFEMQAAGTENFKDWISLRPLSDVERALLKAAKHRAFPRPTSFFVSRQDPKKHPFY